MLFSVHEIGRNCTLLDVLNSAFGVLFLVLFDRLLHLYLLFEPLLVEQFGLDTLQGLSLLSNDLGLPSLLLSSLLIGI